MSHFEDAVESALFLRSFFDESKNIALYSTRVAIVKNSKLSKYRSYKMTLYITKEERPEDRSKTLVCERVILGKMKKELVYNLAEITDANELEEARWASSVPDEFKEFSDHALEVKFTNHTIIIVTKSEFQKQSWYKLLQPVQITPKYVEIFKNYIHPYINDTPYKQSFVGTKVVEVLSNLYKVGVEAAIVIGTRMMKPRKLGNGVTVPPIIVSIPKSEPGSERLHFSSIAYYRFADIVVDEEIRQKPLLNAIKYAESSINPKLIGVLPPKFQKGVVSIGGFLQTYARKTIEGSNEVLQQSVRFGVSTLNAATQRVENQINPFQLFFGMEQQQNASTMVQDIPERDIWNADIDQMKMDTKDFVLKQLIEQLQRPDALENIDEMVAEHQQKVDYYEKLVFETVHTSIRRAGKSIELVGESSESIETVENNYRNMYKEPDIDINNFDEILQVQRIFTNSVKTKNVILQLKRLNTEYNAYLVWFYQFYMERDEKVKFDTIPKAVNNEETLLVKQLTFESIYQRILTYVEIRARLFHLEEGVTEQDKAKFHLHYMEKIDSLETHLLRMMSILLSRIPRLIGYGDDDMIERILNIVRLQKDYRERVIYKFNLHPTFLDNYEPFDFVELFYTSMKEDMIKRVDEHIKAKSCYSHLDKLNAMREYMENFLDELIQDRVDQYYKYFFKYNIVSYFAIQFQELFKYRAVNVDTIADQNDAICFCKNFESIMRPYERYLQKASTSIYSFDDDIQKLSKTTIDEFYVRVFEIFTNAVYTSYGFMKRGKLWKMNSKMKEFIIRDKQLGEYGSNLNSTIRETTIRNANEFKGQAGMVVVIYQVVKKSLVNCIDVIHEVHEKFISGRKTFSLLEHGFFINDMSIMDSSISAIGQNLRAFSEDKNSNAAIEAERSRMVGELDKISQQYEDNMWIIIDRVIDTMGGHIKKNMVLNIKGTMSNKTIKLNHLVNELEWSERMKYIGTDEEQKLFDGSPILKEEDVFDTLLEEMLTLTHEQLPASVISKLYLAIDQLIINEYCLGMFVMHLRPTEVTVNWVMAIVLDRMAMLRSFDVEELNPESGQAYLSHHLLYGIISFFYAIGNEKTKDELDEKTQTLYNQFFAPDEDEEDYERQRVLSQYKNANSATKLYIGSLEEVINYLFTLCYSEESLENKKFLMSSMQTWIDNAKFPLSSSASDLKSNLTSIINQLYEDPVPKQADESDEESEDLYTDDSNVEAQALTTFEFVPEMLEQADTTLSLIQSQVVVMTEEAKKKRSRRGFLFRSRGNNNEADEEEDDNLEEDEDDENYAQPAAQSLADFFGDDDDAKELLAGLNDLDFGDDDDDGDSDDTDSD